MGCQTLPLFLNPRPRLCRTLPLLQDGWESGNEQDSGQNGIEEKVLTLFYLLSDGYDSRPLEGIPDSLLDHRIGMKAVATVNMREKGISKSWKWSSRRLIPTFSTHSIELLASSIMINLLLLSRALAIAISCRVP